MGFCVLRLLNKHALEEVTCIRALVFCDLFRRSLGDDTASGIAPFWSQIDQPVGSFDDIQVVFNDHNRVARIHQAL